MDTLKLKSEEVIELKNKLPYGAIKEIAEKLKLNRDYVSAVLNNLKPYNEQIIREALNIVELKSEDSREIRERFEKLTKKSA